MKQALVGDQLVVAAADAPGRAVCPGCEGAVKLRSRQGTFFWRHVKLPRGGCDPEAGVEDAGDQEAGGAPDERTRQVGAFVIGLHPDEEGGYLTLRSLGREEMGEALRPGSGQASGMVIYPSEVGLLARALIEAVADLVELVVGDQAQGER